ncbi:hypothetical protein COB11_01450 [Candidatus Aerophobetes bacterium]|uniref:DUF177 domain-containing protein n=1 Tax=Aerophobetes bacterium TaxID=2030807 RepID=A0A2A4YLH8_UNCAE|nr:MAG: hypothetical protein COB11_01450 [Candidatus Aerophobetes bacterium]
MSKDLVIYIERLREGESTEIDEVLSATDLELEDDQLHFMPDIKLTGSAYIAEDHLVLNLDISANASIACNVCNADVKIPIELKNTYITKDLSELRSGVFRYVDDLRESILLESPSFAECNNGSCPERTTIEPFLKKEDRKKEDSEVYFPFDDLDEKMEAK